MKHARSTMVWACTASEDAGPGWHCHCWQVHQGHTVHGKTALKASVQDSLPSVTGKTKHAIQPRNARHGWKQTENKYLIGLETALTWIRSTVCGLDWSLMCRRRDRSIKAGPSTQYSGEYKLHPNQAKGELRSNLEDNLPLVSCYLSSSNAILILK